MVRSIAELYQLDFCVNWIQSNKFRRIIVQLKKEYLEFSCEISTYIRDKCTWQSMGIEKPASSSEESCVDIYITQSSTCSVDLLVTQHVSDLDAIIYLGDVCLTKPEICRVKEPKPILLAFGSHANKANFKANVESLWNTLEKLQKNSGTSKLCVFYDSNLIDYAIELEKLSTLEHKDDSIDIVDLYRPDELWQTTDIHEHKFILKSSAIAADRTNFGHYLLKKPVEYYNCSVYLGTRPSIQLALEGPAKFIRINCYNSLELEDVNVSRLLNRRMALVNRLRDEEELKFGVIITNPLPNITKSIERLESYAKPRKHTLYFISMIQTIDECKIGNFDLCDAFIVVNSCTCSTLLESLVFNRPILTEQEFKLACGFEATYGRVLWPGSSYHSNEEDIINKRRVSDVSLALVHTRNELLERCSQARLNKWSGLDYRGTVGHDGPTETVDSLVIEKGLEGVASAYSSEPSNKS